MSFTTPAKVIGLDEKVSSISVGDAHTCALTTNGRAKCWGANYGGQLGNGARISSAKPVNVFGLDEGVSSISAGGSHTCASTKNSGVRCWGSNNRGQLGIVHNYADWSIPVSVVSSDFTYVVGTNSTPVFVWPNRTKGEGVSVHSDERCSTHKGFTRVGAYNTAARVALDNLGIAGDYSLYYQLTRYGYVSQCLGPVKYSF